MIQAAIEKGHRVAVFTTADRMTLADVGALRELRFKRFLVHLPDECQEMKLAVPADLIEVLVALKEGVTGVEFLTLGVPAKKILNAIGAQQSTRRIHSRAGNIALEGRTVGAAFSAEMIAERNLGSSLICRQDRMFSNVLLPDGTLQFCSMDYGLAHSLGSLADQTYDEIISGPAFRRIFEEMARKDSEILCRRCEYAFPGVYQMKS
ncbi:hypothetical protein BwDG23_48430 [Bradyrhizobium ottawaense]|uniref:SPASM domain-containing protein n=1 Tax=Bradyrhizobium ottawaense TaxID=931866 RepID=UPI0027D4B2F8|nr:hypothetical protein BwSG10_48430 [Bradyrhizobium ottawaense]GMP05415.1 hypothetical protein BwDG23_48430 [Bradyrhizobium ottawaense]